MKRLGQSLLFSILLMLLIPVSASASAAVSEGDTVSENSSGAIRTVSNKYRIMVLSSYAMGDEVSSLEIEGLQKALPSDKCEVSYEFMDTRRFSSGYDLSVLYIFLMKKLSRMPEFDCYIAVDDSALDFLMAREDIVGDVPIVYFGIQNSKIIEHASKSSGITGVQENYDFASNFDTIKNLFPGRNNIIFVTDSSLAGKDDTLSFTAAVEADGRFSYEILNISETPESEVKGKLSAAGADSVVIIQNTFNLNDGSISTLGYMTDMLMPYISVPVFSVNMDLTEHGTFGGIIYDCVASGEMAGKMALQIAEGADPSDVPVVTDTPVKAVFNKKMMDHYMIKASALPADAIIVNNEKNFWQRYYKPIVAMTLVISFLLLLIALLSRRVSSQKEEIDSDEEIMRIVTNDAINFAAVINVKDAMVKLRSGAWTKKGAIVPESERTIPYKVFIEKAAQNIHDKKVRERFLKVSDLKYTVETLKRQPEICESMELKPENGPIMQKQFNLSRLDKDVNRILIYETDVTQVLSAEREKNELLRKAAEAAERANAAKTNFVSRISHDIRTPIGAILNLTDFAKKDMDDREALTDDIEKIATSGRFLLSLINDVLDISKIDSNNLELSEEKYNFTDYISEIRNIMDPMCSVKGLKNEVNGTEESNGYFMMIDKVRINQITLNIISNAVKYTPEGGKVSYSGGIYDVKDGKGTLCFTVKDDGIGMSEEFQKVMFDEFSQDSDNPERRKVTTGTGLGLSIVKRITELMSGTIEVKSEVGKGTEMKVSIPVKVEHTEGAGKTETDTDREDGKMHFSGKVLLAEDNLINAEIAKRMIEETGVSVEHAENGAEELEIFRKAPQGTYIAIFQDIQMPVMNGYDAAAAIRVFEKEEGRDIRIPIIAMTADAFTDALERSKEAGMDSFITKPIKEEEIRAMLSKYTEGD